MKTLIVTLFALGAASLALVAWLSHRDARRDARPGAAPRIPRFADLAGFVMAYRVGRVPVGRIAVLGFWWWVGWHFFAR